MAVMKLSQSIIASLACTSGKRRTEFCDSEVAGLYVEVRSTNSKTFYWRAKDHAGKTFHTKIGRVSDISLADARKKVLALKADHANGTNTKSITPAKKGDMLLNDFWTEYLVFAKSTKRSWKRDEQLWRLRIQPQFGHLKLSEITLRQIQKLMLDIRAEKLSGASADHHGQLFRRMGNLAVKWGYLDISFARGIQLYHEFNEVNNLPSDEQFKKLMYVLNTDHNRPICRLVLFLLSTGCRLNEALSAQWKNISIENRVMTVPHESSKSKRPRLVMLNNAALDVLSQIDRKETDRYVFTNPKTQNRFISVFKPWDRIRNAAGMPNFRLHDSRHFFISSALESGCSTYMASQLAGHADSRMVEKRYAHMSKTTMLKAADTVAHKLSAVLRPTLVDEKSQEAA